MAVGCSNQKTTTDKIVSDTVKQSSGLTENKSASDPVTQITLTDTVLNGHAVKFHELTQATFDSLLRQSKQTEIEIKSAENQIKRLDSCVLIKLLNQKMDTLCNKHDGEYFEKYLVKGLWEENNLLLVHFDNWEESHDFFLSLKDGSYYVLTPFYEVNPKREMLLTYVDIAAIPIYIRVN